MGHGTARPEDGMGGVRPLIWAALAFIILALGGACGGDDDDSASPSPSEPTATGSIAPGSPAPSGDKVIDMATAEPLLKIYGRAAGDLASDLPALAAGDFNDDGIDDLLIGARFADPSGDRVDAGEAYVVFGSADIGGTADLSAGGSVTVEGAGAGDNLGFSAAAADLNGDGIDDFAVGAPFAASGRIAEQTPGAVYIIFGDSDLGGRVDVADGADVSLVGDSPSSYFGDSLATGDVNGDGADDLIVGATFAQPPGGGPQAGAAYIFYGRPEWPDTIALTDGGYDAALFGEETLDELGETVVVGDINGDGFGDIVATAEAADGPDNERSVAGEVAILFGAADLEGDFFDGRDEVTRILGAEQNDTVGFDLAVGDLDGDGRDDIAMTARLASGPGNDKSSAGEAYLLFGGSDLPEVIDLATEAANLAGYYAPDSADLMGRVVIVPAEDGPGRLLLGTGFGDGPAGDREGAGEVYSVEPGRMAGMVQVDQAASRIVYGAREGDGFGASFLAIDINGDGELELAVVAAGADPSANQADFGIVYLIAMPG